MKTTILFLCGGLTLAFSATARTPDPPVMRWDRPVTCATGPRSGEPIRLQCTRSGDPGHKRCLYASACEVGTRATGCRALQRVRPCMSQRRGTRWADRVQKGYVMVKAISESPPGWMRDERGRVFQYNFDLGRRVWLGARWPFAAGPDDRLALGRVGLEHGLRAEVLSRSGRTRWRYHALVGEVMLNPLSVDATLLTIDTSHESKTPLLRFTTFWPRPRRHDLHLNLGFWAALGGVEHGPRGSEDETIIRFAAAAATWDLWHGPDLSSYVRLRSGIAADDLFLRRDDVGDRFALTPLVYAEGEITVDRDGFHHLGFHAGYEAPLVWEDDTTPTQRNRFSTELAYELILLAINDQPLTLRASVGGGYRDDLVDEASGWELTAGVGLRFSLWVPPRDLRAVARARKRLGLPAEPQTDTP